MPTLGDIKDFSELDPDLELALAAVPAEMPSAANDDLTVVDNVDFELHQQQDGSEEATRTQQVETQQTNEPANNSVAPDE